MNWKERSTVTGKKFSWKSIQIPWFIFGFLLMSAIYSSGAVPEPLAEKLVMLSYILMAMLMAGLGLNIDLATFRKYGGKPFLAGLVGSIFLTCLQVCIGSGFPFKLTFQFKQASLNRHACFFLLDVEHWHHKKFHPFPFEAFL